MNRPGICVDGPAYGIRINVDDQWLYVNVALKAGLEYLIPSFDSPAHNPPPILHETYKITQRLTKGGLIICEHQP